MDDVAKRHIATTTVDAFRRMRRLRLPERYNNECLWLLQTQIEGSAAIAGWLMTSEDSDFMLGGESE